MVDELYVDDKSITTESLSTYLEVELDYKKGSAFQRFTVAQLELIARHKSDCESCMRPSLPPAVRQSTCLTAPACVVLCAASVEVDADLLAVSRDEKVDA
jgi:hypothetical protein